MGKPPAPDSNAPDKRSIIVKFIRRDDKFLVIKTARDIKTRVPGLFVNESLTPIRAKIFKVLRQCKKMNGSPITGTSTHNGRVFVHHKPSLNAPEGSRSLKTELNTKSMLAEFCTNFLKKSLDKVLDDEGRKIFG